MNNGAHVAALQRIAERLRRRLEFVEGSRFWALRDVWLALRRSAGFPALDEPPAVRAADFTEAMGAQDPYTHWLLANEPRDADLARMRDAANVFAWQPSIAIVVDDAVGNAARTIDSIRAQAYPNTELLLCSRYANGGDESDRFNAALAACRADIVAFCDAQHALAPHATFEIALAFNLAADSVAAYGDRDVCDAGGARSEPHFAPDWSPETFLSEMYVGPVVFYRRDAIVRAGGFRAGCGRASHYDLALRVLDDGARVAHRSTILVHELRDGALAPGAAEQRDVDADRVVAEALDRRGEPGSVQATPCPCVRVVRYRSRPEGRTEVIVATRDLASELDRCLRSVYARNVGSHLRVTLVDNGSVEPETAELLEAYTLREPERFRVLRMDEPFNFSRLVNAAVRSCDGPYILLLNNDAAFVSDGGIAAMLEQARRPSIGAVGARLTYADASIQHAGVVIGIGGYAGHVYRGVSAETAASNAAISSVRNYAAVTAACMMVRRDAFEAVDGFDERLAVEFNDIDFCLKLGRAGLRNVYLPHVLLRHDESSSRSKSTVSAATVARERALFRATWHSLTYRDPYYNTNLTREREDGTLAP